MQAHAKGQDVIYRHRFEMPGNCRLSLRSGERIVPRNKFRSTLCGRTSFRGEAVKKSK